MKITESLTLAATFSLFLIFKLYMVYKIDIPIWDASAFLVNARNMLHGEPLYEWFRPPLVSALIAFIWAIGGENLLIVKPLDTLFTTGSAVILYLILRRHGVRHYIAIIAATLFLTSTQVLLWSDYILSHAPTTFFTLLMVFFLFPPRSSSPHLPHTMIFLGGISASLAFFSRYTTLVTVAAIFFTWFASHRRLSYLFAFLVGALTPVIIYTGVRGIGVDQFAVELMNIYTIHGANPGDPSSESPLYYVEKYWPNFKVLGLLALPAIFQRSSYTDRNARVWIFWLASALIFGALTSNRQLRFTFEWVPAISALAALSLQRIVEVQKSRDRRIAAALIIAFLAAASATLSVNEYFQSYDSIRLQNPPELRRVASILEGRTLPSETALSNFFPPTLTYLSERTVFGIQDIGSVQDLKLFIEQGYGYRWTKPSYVIIAEGYGRLPISSIQKVDFLQLEQTITLKDGSRVYFYRVVMR